MDKPKSKVTIHRIDRDFASGVDLVFVEGVAKNLNDWAEFDILTTLTDDEVKMYEKLEARIQERLEQEEWKPPME